MTLFLISTFILVLLFEIEIATVSLFFLVFGDMFGKIFGLAYGRHKILDKTLEGTLAHLGAVLLFGYILYNTLDISLVVLIVGGITSPIAELLPIGVNDNFTIPIMSGTVMRVADFFGF